MAGDMRYSNDLEPVARDIVDEIRTLNLDILNSGDERNTAGQGRKDPTGKHNCNGTSLEQLRWRIGSVVEILMGILG